MSGPSRDDALDTGLRRGPVPHRRYVPRRTGGPQVTEFDVVCVGCVTVDSIAVVDHVPAEDERVESQPFVDSGGGPAATAAVTLARLGHRVAFCGVTGPGTTGARARELLDAEGVDTRWLRVRPGARTARSMILVSRSAGAPGGGTPPRAPPD